MSNKSKEPISEQQFVKMLNSSSLSSMSTQRFNDEVMPRLVHLRIENLVLLLLHRLIRKVSNPGIPINERRFIRMKDAPSYLSVDKNYFNKIVRPTLTEIPIRIQGIAFDRLDLDKWADDHKSRVGRPGTTLLEE